jgi:hypothetical protein
MPVIQVPLEKLSPRNLVKWVVQKMSEDTLPSAMKRHMHKNKKISDYPSLALCLHGSSNRAMEIVSFFTPNALIDLFEYMTAPKLGTGIEEISFPRVGTVTLSDGLESFKEAEELMKKYFSDYMGIIYDIYTKFEDFGAYRDFEEMKKEFDELEVSLPRIESLFTSPNREDFLSKLRDAEKNASQIGKKAESILNRFFYAVREANMTLSKTDILEKYKNPKKDYWNWAEKEEALKKFSKDASRDEEDEALQDLAQVVRNLLNAYLVTDNQHQQSSIRQNVENIETALEKIRDCRNMSAHQELGLEDVKIILQSVSHSISKIESVAPRCCLVVRAELSPWITVLKLSMEGKKGLVEVHYPTRDLEKYTCFAEHSDITRASEDLDLFLALPTKSPDYNQFFLVRYGEISDKGVVTYQSRFGSQSSLQKLAIEIKLKESPKTEYVPIPEAV